MKKWLDNYNDSKASAPEGMVGDGYSNVGRNYSPAWGGSFQMGGSVYPVNYVPQAQNGKLTFLQPTSDKLPEGYVIPYNTPSSERAMSIGGENGEPAYLIPSFKYGKPLADPIGEFRKTGDHLGGPFKTWQEAEEWEKTVRHPAVEKKETIMFPQEKFAMGGSIPGAVGFTYARTGSPSKGPRRNQTDVTDASAKNGDVIVSDRGQWDHPGEITEIGSNQITMRGVPYPVLGVSNTGDTQMMYPEEEYKFDGEKVTEYPIAQNGFDAKAFQKVLDEKFPRSWRKKKDINIRETNLVKKDNINVKQKNEIIIPTKKEKAIRSVQDQKEYMKGWMDSPMYNEMVDNSTTGISDNFFLNLNRDINYDAAKVIMMNKNLTGEDKNVGANSNSTTGLIKVYPKGYQGPQLEGMISHEISHTTDKPVKWKGKARSIHEFLGDPYIDGKRAIPKKDIDLMQSYYKGNDSYTELFNKNALNNTELNEDRNWFNYVSEPTETRARLNDIRYNAKKYNIYDPFKEKVDVKKLNEIRKLSKKAGGFDPFNQLRDVYSEDQIINMLNTISQNDTKEDRSVSMAKNGIRQEQKGLVNLDNLTNFTNYNKPQPGGWLNKYN